MARKNKILQIKTEGRDKGKIFILTEMDALKGEKWAARAFLALMRSGVDIPENTQQAGLAGIATLGLNALAGARFEEAEPLMDEMMKCVTYQPDTAHPEVVRALFSDDIEEISTILAIRKELITLHTGFSFPASLSTSGLQVGKVEAQ